MTTRCTGHCCQAFWFSGDYDLLMRDPTHYEDGAILADMMIPLGLQGAAFDGTPIDPPAPLFTCRHFDEVAGSCRNYEGRPMMCRTHGVDNTCTYSECTLKTDLVQIGGLA